MSNLEISDEPSALLFDSRSQCLCEMNERPQNICLLLANLLRGGNSFGVLKLRRKALSIVCLVGIFAGGLVWQFGPFQAVFVIANLSDPKKLATLGERAANPRLNKIVYWLHEADGWLMSSETAVGLAQFINGTGDPRASLVKESLLRNLKIADELGLLTDDNKKLLRNGKAAVVTKGPKAGSKAEIDHIVPYSLAPEAGNELANLEMMPQEMNRAKSNRVGSRHLSHAEKLYSAGLITKESLAKVRARAKSTRTEGADESRPRN
jgi:hypothetical protein